MRRPSITALIRFPMAASVYIEGSRSVAKHGINYDDRTARRSINAISCSAEGPEVCSPHRFRMSEDLGQVWNLELASKHPSIKNRAYHLGNLGNSSEGSRSEFLSKMAQFGMLFLIYNSTVKESRKENFK